MGRLVNFVGTVLCFAEACSLPAQAQRPAPTASLKNEAGTAELDQLLAARDYRKLGERIGQPADNAVANMNGGWLRQRMMAGSSAFVALLYTRWLWSNSERLPPDQQAELRSMAGLAALYFYAATKIDGQRCGDRTAPIHRWEQASQLDPELLPFIWSRPADTRAIMIEGALLTERKTAAVRDRDGDVAFLCSGGIEEITYNLSHGTTREVPAGPGQAGRQMVTTGDGKYKPSERPAEEWQKAAEIARANLPQMLAQLVSRPKP